MSLTYQIHKRIENLFINYEYKLHNSFVFQWESDFFGVSKSGYSIEVEVKISKSDFNHDFKKQIKYRNILKHDFIADEKQLRKPNKFFYAFPKGLISHDKIPAEYGIIEYKDNYCSITRNAKFLHKNKLMSENWFLLQLLKKFYYRNIDLRISMGVRDCDIKYNQKRLDIEYYYIK